MEDEWLKKIWQNTSEDTQIEVAENQLLTSLRHQIHEMDRYFRRRNYREIVAAGVLVCGFGYYAFTIPLLKIQIASVYHILWAVVLVLILVRFRRQKPKPDATTNLKDYLQQYKHYLVKEKQLSEKGIPLFLVSILPGTGLFLTSPIYTWMQTLFIGITFLLILVVVVYWNRRKAQKTLQPLINQLGEAVALLAANND